MQELGWCYEKIEDYENALDVWEYEFTPPLSWYKIAQVYDKLGKNSDSLWLNIATKYSDSDYALKSISKLPKDSVLLRGKIYYLAGSYDSAIKWLGGVKDGEEFLALSLYKLNKYKEALDLARTYSLWFLAGECNKKLGFPDSAIIDYTKSGNSEALFSKAQLLLDLGRKEDALSVYHMLPDTSVYFEFSNLRAGLLALEAGKLEAAEKYFNNVSPPISYYWCYKIKSIQGNKWRANLYRQKLISDYPISYYTWLLGENIEFLKISPEKWIISQDSTSVLPDEQLRFERGKLLFELGITAYGTAEFKKLPDKPLLSWKVAKFLHINGFPWLAIPYARRLENFKGSIPREFAKVLYPISFLTEIRNSARTHNIDEFLLLGLIREESHFNPGAISSSNAMGLAQIIPPTGKQIAKQLGIKSYSLFHPATNLDFGAFYIAQCLKLFNGSWQCTLAGYNGGPHNVKKWLTERDSAKMDEWVEWIPYKQTRNYVRIVIRSYFAYKTLYGDNLSHSVQSQDKIPETKD
jgi:soluble lytic murein transglycosylase-like protein